MAGSGGHVFHVVNRAVEGQLLFRDFGEYLAFKHLLAKALTKVGIRLLGYCLMPNHWHFVLWPHTDDEVTRFIRWLSATHARALRHWRGTVGKGAIYQSRFRASRVDTERYFYAVMRYVERNAQRAGLVDRAEDWPWCSASGAALAPSIALADWPLPRPRDWYVFLGQRESGVELEFIRASTQRNDPISDATEVSELAPDSIHDVATTETPARNET